MTVDILGDMDMEDARMKHVYLLWHTRREDEYGDDSKLLGVYSSRELAQERIDNHYIHQPGFSEHKDGFEISRYEIDKMEWTEGFGVAGPPKETE